MIEAAQQHYQAGERFFRDGQFREAAQCLITQS